MAAKEYYHARLKLNHLRCLSRVTRKRLVEWLRKKADEIETEDLNLYDDNFKATFYR